jgi:hypothetical protein
MGTVGGGIGNAGNGTVTLTNTTVSHNSSAGTGGGFGDVNGQGTLVLVQSEFDHNSAVADGGGIAAGGASTSITSSEIDSNTTGASGGGIFVNGVQLVLQKATIAHNMATASGGGIELQTTGTGTSASTITDATLFDNTVLSNGGGADGGGIDAPSTFTGAVTLLNDTINQNFADFGGGIFWAGTAGSAFKLQNTIVADNNATLAGPDANNPAGAFTDLGGNLIGVAGAGSGNTGFTAATTQTGTAANPLDPRLGPLQYNGGPVVGAFFRPRVLRTEAPLPGSPAIGKGLIAGAPATDERGFPSIVNGKINVGAVAQGLNITGPRPGTRP